MTQPLVDVASSVDRVASASRRHRRTHSHTPLLRGVSVATAGHAIYAACQWLLLVVLAKFGTPQLVGEFALALAITGPVVLFSQLNLRSVLATDTRREFSLGDYLALRVVTTAVALMALIGGAFAFGGSATSAAAIVLVAIAKSIDSLTDVFLGAWQREERFDSVSVIYASNGALSTAAVSAALLLTGSVIWSAAAFAAGSLAAFVATVAMHKSVVDLASHDGVRMNTVWRLARLALPLGPVMLLVTLNANVPRYFLATYAGTRDLGLFAAMASLIALGTMVVGALGQSLAPRLAAHYEHDRASFAALFRTFVTAAAMLGAVTVIASAVAGPELLTLFYSPEYAATATVLPLVMLGGALGYVGSAFGFAMTAARRFSVQVPLFLGVTATTAAASTVLVPRFGMQGAAWAALAGAVVQVGGSAIVLRSSLNGRAARMVSHG